MLSLSLSQNVPSASVWDACQEHPIPFLHIFSLSDDVLAISAAKEIRSSEFKLWFWSRKHNYVCSRLAKSSPFVILLLLRAAYALIAKILHIIGTKFDPKNRVTTSLPKCGLCFLIYYQYANIARFDAVRVSISRWWTLISSNMKPQCVVVRWTLSHFGLLRYRRHSTLCANGWRLIVYVFFFRGIESSSDGCAVL